MDATDALDIIRGELDPLRKHLADQLVRETDSQRIARALQVAHGEALGRIIGRLEALDGQARANELRPRRGRRGRILRRSCGTPIPTRCG